MLVLYLATLFCGVDQGPRCIGLKVIFSCGVCKFFNFGLFKQHCYGQNLRNSNIHPVTKSGLVDVLTLVSMMLTF